MDKSYSLLVSNKNPELLLNYYYTNYHPGQLDAITTRLLFNASIIVLLETLKKEGILICRIFSFLFGELNFSYLSLFFLILNYLLNHS